MIYVHCTAMNYNKNIRTPDSIKQQCYPNKQIYPKVHNTYIKVGKSAHSKMHHYDTDTLDKSSKNNWMTNLKIHTIMYRMWYEC